MKFGQLIEYNVGNILLEKKYTKCGGETILGPFPKKLKLSISKLSILNGLKFYTLCSYRMPSWGLPKYIEIKAFLR